MVSAATTGGAARARLWPLFQRRSRRTTIGSARAAGASLVPAARGRPSAISCAALAPACSAVVRIARSTQHACAQRAPAPPHCRLHLGSFEADNKQHAKEGWATPELVGPVTDPYALNPGTPNTAETRPTAVWYSVKPPDPAVERSRGCRTPADGRGTDPGNVPVDCTLGVAEGDSAPNLQAVLE